MEKVVSVVHRSKGGTSKMVQQQISKTRRKPVKVVYISNPVKIKTSASQFRAVVQELTGQDAPLPPPPPHHHLHQPQPAGETGVRSSRRGSHQLSYSFVSSADYDDDDDDDGRPGPEEDDEQYYSHQPRPHAPNDVWSDPDYNLTYSYGLDLSFEAQGCSGSRDDGFMPQLLENFPPSPLPSNLWC